MGPKTQERYDELHAEYKRARANGEMGTAVRLLTRMKRLENGEKEEPEETDEG